MGKWAYFQIRQSDLVVKSPVSIPLAAGPCYKRELQLGDRRDSVEGAAKMAKRWKLIDPQPERAGFIARELNLHPIVAALLVNRGVASADDARRYMARRLNDLRDPELHPGASEAADRLFAAARDGRKICVYGDYDVDGMCATALLIECLRLGGVQARFHVPDRIEEGYGLNCHALDRLKAEGIDLVISVDCGIASVREAEHARAIDLELIVTDHHEFGESLPPADCLVHPCLPGSDYPFSGLCGAGVAFKVAWELARRFSGQRKTTEQFQKFLLDATSLTAIATICDVVPLADENRVLVHHGLRGLRESPPLGLKALIEIAKLEEKSRFSTMDIGFAIGPRLNACGRLGQARLGVELLVTRDEKRAREIAAYLENENRVRQTLERRVFLDAREKAEATFDLTTPSATPAIVLASDDWHPGVIGIVAGRMVERYHRPCVLIALKETEGAGSGRSIAGIHLQEALAACGDRLLTSGGHAMAAGLRIAANQIDGFRDAFCAEIAKRNGATGAGPILSIDTEAPLAHVNRSLLDALDLMAPFGQGNAEPLFLASDVIVDGDPKRIGNGDRHLSFMVRQGSARLRAVAFGQAERAEELVSQAGRCCLVFSPQLNEFRGVGRVELIVKDFRPGSSILASAEPAA